MNGSRHLSGESLARLLDEKPDPAEAEHLRSCRVCREEVEALRAQTEALGSLPDLMPPRGDWEELEARLVSEGLVRGRPAGGAAGFSFRGGWGQIAAALVVFAAGSAMGAGVARGTPDPLPRQVERTGVLPVQTASSAEEAGRVLQEAEESYMAALMQYRRLAGFDEDAGTVADPVSRFAALDALLSASQAALRQAPADPFLNGVLVSTMAERQATLQQISTTEDQGSWY